MGLRLDTRIGRLGGLALAGWLAAGCTTTVDGITLLSTRNVDMSGQHEPAGERLSRSDGRLWLLFIPLGGAPSPKEATTELLEANHADYLKNAEVTSGGWSLIVLSYGWFSVEGDPWRTESLPAVSAPPLADPMGH